MLTEPKCENCGRALQAHEERNCDACRGYPTNVGRASSQSYGLKAVLSYVRRTGVSAHPAPGETIISPVFAVAVLEDLNPVELQAEVNAHALR